MSLLITLAVMKTQASNNIQLSQTATDRTYMNLLYIIFGT